jgi:hypothetical protein
VAALVPLLAPTLPAARIVGPDTGGAAPLAWLQGFLPLVEPVSESGHAESEAVLFG